jgi:hypothetical protein
MKVVIRNENQGRVAVCEPASPGHAFQVIDFFERGRAVEIRQQGFARGFICGLQRCDVADVGGTAQIDLVQADVKPEGAVFALYAAALSLILILKSRNTSPTSG